MHRLYKPIFSIQVDPDVVKEVVKKLLIASSSDAEGKINDKLLGATLNAIVSDERMKTHLETKKDAEKEAMITCLKEMAQASKETMQKGSGIYAQKMVAYNLMGTLFAMIAKTADISHATMETMFGVNRHFIAKSDLGEIKLSQEAFADLLKLWSTRDDSAKREPDDLVELWEAYWLDACTISASTKDTVSCSTGGGSKTPHRIYWLTEDPSDIYDQLVADWPNFHCSRSTFLNLRPKFVKDPDPTACVCTNCQQVDDTLVAYKSKILQVHRQDLPAVLDKNSISKCKTTYLLANPTSIICETCGKSNRLFEVVEDSPFQHTYKMREYVKTAGDYMRLMCCDGVFGEVQSEGSFNCTCVDGTCNVCPWKNIKYCDKATNSTHVFTYDMLTAEKKQSVKLDRHGKVKTSKVYLTRDTHSTFIVLAKKLEACFPGALAHKKRKELMYDWQYKKLPAFLQKGKY